MSNYVIPVFFFSIGRKIKIDIRIQQKNGA